MKNRAKVTAGSGEELQDSMDSAPSFASPECTSQNLSTSLSLPKPRLVNGWLGQRSTLLDFPKFFLCPLQIGQALFELGAKDLRLLVQSGVLDRNGSGDRE